MTNKALIYSIFLLIIFKITAIYFTDFDLYGDEAQYWLWSQALDFGYYSKPPLLAWFLNGYSSIFGSSFVSLKIFPIIVYFLFPFQFIHFVSLYHLIKKVLGCAPLVF